MAAPEAQYLVDPDVQEFTASAAVVSGEVIQLADGRAGVVAGLAGFSAGDTSAAHVTGVCRVAKATGAAILKGGKVYFVRANSNCTGLQASGDFFVGTCVKDALAADTTVDVELNVEPQYHIELGKGTWTQSDALGLGTTNMVGGGIKMEFDAVAEIARASLLSDEAVAVADGPIFEARLAVFDIGDAAALDANFGLANAGHATDFDSVTEQVTIHFDGASLNIMAESDDGTTEVAATDTTVDAVDNTYFELWIDCRDIDDIIIYIDGVLVLAGTAFKLDAATGPMKAIAHMEKTSDDTTADFRVDFMRVRSTDVDNTAA